MADHDHVWEWDHEEPPGYVCTVEGCGERTLACENCEQPTHMKFCSATCESEYELSLFDPDKNDEDGDDEDCDDEDLDGSLVDEMADLADMSTAETESVLKKLQAHRIGKLSDLLKPTEPKLWNESRQQGCYIPHTVDLEPGVHDVDSWPMSNHFRFDRLVFGKTEPEGSIQLHHPEIVMGKLPIELFAAEDYGLSADMQRQLWKQRRLKPGEKVTFKLENTTDKPVKVRYLMAGIVDYKPEPPAEDIQTNLIRDLPVGVFLVDVEQRAQAHPVSFRIPPREERLGLRPGQSAKLVFIKPEVAEGVEPAHKNAGERLWVDVVGRYLNADWKTIFTGKLSSTPIAVPELKRGDLVTFYAENVASIYKPVED